MKILRLLISNILMCCVVPIMAHDVNYTTIADTTRVESKTVVQQPADTAYIPIEVIEQLGDTPTVFVLSPGERLYRNQYFQMGYVGIPLVVAGVATQGCTSMRFKELRDAYVPHFDYAYDDYLQYAPGVALLITKACGVNGRSSWERMIVSDLFSVALMAGIVNGLKYSVGTMRPDGSTANSFPSGHTATAFMTAHMLHKEYGHVSPWVSVGGYAVATTVGVSRVLNNRHWVSDVLAGAGIGILSVELGYFITDLIYKEKGLNAYDTQYFTIPDRPSSLGLTMGLSLPLATIDIGDGKQLVSTTGSRMGVEGVWYINPYVGVGATATISTMPTMISGNEQERLSIDAMTLSGGVFGSIPLGENSRFRANVKALAGCNYMPHDKLLPDVITTSRCGFYYETGVSFSVVARRHFGASFFCDYGGYCFTATHTPSLSHGLTRNGRYNYVMHTATVGINTSILF